MTYNVFGGTLNLAQSVSLDPRPEANNFQNLIVVYRYHSGKIFMKI